MPKTVLLADDSITIQHAVGISLANEDIALINVNNGEDAILKARAIKPDLMLLDVVMPKLSGYDVCKQVRADPSIKHTPIIMLVGAIEGFDENKFKEAMANDYIIKPFESGALINKIRKYLYPELASTVSPYKAAAQSGQEPVTPQVVVPNIPVPPVQTQPQKKQETNPLISIPPKPATPPVAPPVIPPTNVHQFTVPPVPPMPPHIAADKKKSTAAEDVAKVTSFVDNLVTPPDIKPQEPSQEMVDEISPQEIEEITSEIPDMGEKQPAVNPPEVVDIVSQVVESVAKTEQTAPTQSITDKEPPSQFSIDDWGVELNKEIMEETKAPIDTAIQSDKGLSSQISEEGMGVKIEKETMEGMKTIADSVAKSVEQPAIVDEKAEVVKESQQSAPVEPPMQVVTIAESISTEPAGAPVKPLEVPQESMAAVQVEPTSLVEPAINLSGALSEEAMKYIQKVVERIVWEVVPELAENLIKQEIKRLMSEKEE